MENISNLGSLGNFFTVHKDIGTLFLILGGFLLVTGLVLYAITKTSGSIKATGGGDSFTSNPEDPEKDKWKKLAQKVGIVAVSILVGAACIWGTYIILQHFDLDPSKYFSNPAPKPSTSEAQEVVAEVVNDLVNRAVDQALERADEAIFNEAWSETLDNLGKKEGKDI